MIVYLANCNENEDDLYTQRATRGEQKFNAVQERCVTVVRGKRRHHMGQRAILAKLDDLYAEIKPFHLSLRHESCVLCLNLPNR